MPNPSVYIIVLSWNQKEYTQKCLDSLSKAEYDNYRVVLVDNGSRDGTAELVERDYDWVKLVKNQRNLGFTGGNIKGAEVALSEGADYIMLLNNDVEVAPDFLAKLIDVAEKDERIGAVGPLLYYYDNPEIVWSAGFRLRWLGLYNEMLFIGRKDDEVPHLLETQLITGAALCIKRKVIEQVGFLDDLYFCYSEDLDLCYRIWKAGYKLITVKASKIWHKVSASTGSHYNPVNQYLISRGRAIFIKKFGTAWQKVAFLPLAVAEATYTTIREFFKRNAMAAMIKYKGYYDGWRKREIGTHDIDAMRLRFGDRKE